ncbi:MAG TPA: hypothetical protein VGD76_08450 [Ramlibacter sp.]
MTTTLATAEDLHMIADCVNGVEAARAAWKELAAIHEPSARPRSSRSMTRTSASTLP